MTTKFFSVLGTGQYEKYVYKYNNFCMETPYIQEFLCEYFCNRNINIDEYVIFNTTESKIANWDDKLENYFIKKNKNVNNVIVPVGANNSEIEQLFQYVYESIGESDEIYFDITHSVRIFPVLILSALNYAKRTKKIKIMGIYYGSLIGKNYDGDKEVIPVFDINKFNEL